MVSVVLTTDMSLNGGSVDIEIEEYDSNGNIVNSVPVSATSGLESSTVSGFDGQDGGKQYAVNITLNHSDPTRSPVVRQVTLDAPGPAGFVFYDNGTDYEEKRVYTHDGDQWVSSKEVLSNDGSSW